MADTTTFSPILTAAQVNELFFRPLTQQSIAGQTMTTVLINEHSYRFPIVTADPSAGWVAESAEIPVSDMTLAEQTATPSKLAALSVISQELADDSSPPAVAAVGAGIVRDLTRKLDQALFTATTTNGPGGLPGVAGVTAVSAGASYGNVDSFTAAVYSAAQQNATID